MQDIQELQNKEYYHRYVYMPHNVLRKAVKQLNKACDTYSLTLSKHFQQRIRQRKIDFNLIDIDSIRYSKIVQVELINGIVNKLLIRYNIGEHDLYICICVNNELLLVTAYKRITDYRYSKEDLIKTGKYIIGGK